MNRLKGKFIKGKNLARYQKISETNRLVGHQEDHSYGGLHALPDLGAVSHQEVVLTETEVKKCEFNGRCIVELEYLAKELQHCQHCSQPLHLYNCINKKVIGLAAVLDIFCPLCDNISSVATGKKHGNVYDVNTKVSTALIHSGIGVSQLNSILTCLNIPAVHHSLISRRLKESGNAVEGVAQESVDNALEEEVDANREIEVSVDGGWQKRGCGKSYDSLSGHCTMIGCKTGKVLGFAVRSKTCRICESALRLGTQPGEHSCRRNWSGSAKAMEPDMVLEMVKDVQGKGIRTKAIVGDDDAASISKLRAKIDASILKRSDKNHVRKTVSSLLFALQKKRKSFSTKTIRYFLKLFGYVLCQNKGNPDGIAQGLEALGCHPFGDHTCCQSWCEKKQNPAAKFSSLPYGKPLANSDLRHDINQIFRGYLRHTEKLSNLGSTQANESLNKSIASKAPKYLHLSGSANLNYRVAASVAQNNIGRQYVINVHRRIGISPGSHTFKLLSLQDHQARKRKAICNSHRAKRRRRQLKQKRSQNRTTSEVKEGPNYQPNLELLDHEVGEKIPEGIVVVNEQIQHKHENAKSTNIFFDLETTSVGRTSHIVQIAAVRGEEKFNLFVLPKKKMTSKATEITGITSDGNHVYYQGQVMAAYGIKDALTKFIIFLNQSKNNLLFAHNCKSFDCQVLTNALHSCHLFEEFSNSVVGFVDTLHFFRKHFQGLDSYKQVFLANHFLTENYNAHNALSDVCTLQRIFESASEEKNDLTLFYFTCNYCVEKFRFSCNRGLSAKLLYLHFVKFFRRKKKLFYFNGKYFFFVKICKIAL